VRLAARRAGRLLDLGWLNLLQMRTKFDQARRLYIAGRIGHSFADQPYAIPCEFGPRTFVLLVNPSPGPPPQAFQVQQFVPASESGALAVGERHDRGGGLRAVPSVTPPLEPPRRAVGGFSSF
jgi:hypothetical protein